MNSNTAPLTDSAISRGKPVPERYRGVWCRTLLAAPGMPEDTTTTVLWLQTSSWHADLRIPARRPDFSGVSTMNVLSAAQKAWLASQQGFAGVTEITNSGSTEICTWHRVLDYQPTALIPDAGCMWFSPDKLIETGVHQDYLEHWEKLPGSDEGFAVLERTDEIDTPAYPRELLLVAGRYLMHVRDRRVGWPASVASGDTLSKVLTNESQLLLDMEISFGCTTEEGWTVQHSLLPWQENKSVPAKIIAQENTKLKLMCDGAESVWRKIEWSNPCQ